MSAYLTIATPLTDRDCLLAALADLGFGPERVEVHEEPMTLVGYEGGRRAQTAHVIVRRAHVGASSNDIGFLSTPTGYRMIVSSYDQQRYGGPWQERLGERYQHHYRQKMERAAEEERRRQEEARRRLVEAERQTILTQAKKLGYRVEESREGDRLRLVLVRRTY